MKFLSPQGVLYDYIGEVPTAKDCEDCRPNAMGYWSPLENGPMFTGPFLQAMVLRAKRTKTADDRAWCKLLAEGLLLLASVSDEPGFVCRGVGLDGKCHYPVGGPDQTVPWFLGLDVYLHRGLCDEQMKKRIVGKFTEVGTAMEAQDWSTPLEGRFKTRKNSGICMQSLPFRGATQYLFVLRALADATQNVRWKALYDKWRNEKYPRPNTCDLTLLEICERGCGFDAAAKPDFKVNPNGLWIYVGCAQGCLATLAAREEDATVARRYRTGLENSADYARSALALAKEYPNVAERPLKYAQWRAGWTWREQNTLADAQAVSNKTNGNWNVLGTRKKLERRTMTAPLSAAAICAYAGLYRDEVVAVLDHYDYSTISLSESYAAPLAYELLYGSSSTNPERSGK